MYVAVLSAQIEKLRQELQHCKCEGRFKSLACVCTPYEERLDILVYLLVQGFLWGALVFIRVYTRVYPNNFALL